MIFDKESLFWLLNPLGFCVCVTVKVHKVQICMHIAIQVHVSVYECDMSVLACLFCVCTCGRSAIPVWTAGYWVDGRSNMCKNAWGWTLGVLGLVGACTEATCLHLHLSIHSSSSFM